MSLYYGLNRTWYMYYGTGQEPQVVLTVWSLLAALFGLGLALGVVIAVGLLLVFQVKSILRNQTGIEDWIMEKATYRHRNTDTQFVWPYNLGRLANLRLVMQDTGGWHHLAGGGGHGPVHPHQGAAQAEGRQERKNQIIPAHPAIQWSLVPPGPGPSCVLPSPLHR